jgi:hypothetical protein
MYSPDAKMPNFKFFYITHFSTQPGSNHGRELPGRPSNPSLKYAHLFLKVRALSAFSGPPGAYKYIHKASGGQCAVSIAKNLSEEIKGTV